MEEEDCEEKEEELEEEEDCEEEEEEGKEGRRTKMRKRRGGRRRRRKRWWKKMVRRQEEEEEEDIEKVEEEEVEEEAEEEKGGTEAAAGRRWSSVLGDGVSAAVGGGDVDGQRAPRLLHHLQHLHLRLQLQAVAALALHQGGAGPLHPRQPPAQGGQQLGAAGRAGVLHREVDPSARPMHVHVGGAGELQGWRNAVNFSVKYLASFMYGQYVKSLAFCP